MSPAIDRLDALSASSWAVQRTGDGTPYQTWWVTLRFADGSRVRRGSRTSLDDAISRAEQVVAEQAKREAPMADLDVVICRCGQAESRRDATMRTREHGWWFCRRCMWDEEELHPSGRPWTVREALAGRGEESEMAAVIRAVAEVLRG